MGKNDNAFAALIIGGIGGGALAYCKGHADGYQKAKSEDAAYIRRLEDDNTQLRNSNSISQAELLQERRSKAQLREELDRLKAKMTQPTSVRAS